MTEAPWPQVVVSPDPRISAERPAWLTDDQHWRDQLQAMDLSDDIRWIEGHWDMAGGAEPQVDTSWVTVEYFGIAEGPLWLLLLAALVGLALAGALIGTGLMRG